MPSLDKKQPSLVLTKTNTRKVEKEELLLANF